METNLQSFHKIDPFEPSIGYTLFMTISSISPLWSIMGEGISIVWWMSWLVSARDVISQRDFVVCIKHLFR